MAMWDRNPFYDAYAESIAAQQMAEYQRQRPQNGSQGLNDALRQLSNQQPNSVNPEPNPVLLLLE